MDQICRELMHVGLSEKEAAVYTAALQLGPAPVQDIAELAQVNRATTYVMIELLEKRGLISSSTKDKKHIYIAEAPERLLALLRVQKKELEEQEEELQKALPKLQAIFNRSGEKPEVRYFEGMEGIETVRRGYEALQGETVQIIGYDAFTNVIEYDATKHHRETLTKEKVAIRAIIVSARTREQLADQFWQDFDFRVVHPKDFPFKVEGEITIRADHLHLFTYTQGPLAIEIHSSVLANTFRALFDVAWKAGK